MARIYIRTIQKGLNDLDNHHCEVILLEPEKCEVKQALGSITTNKAGGGNGISAELFKV